MSEMLKVASFSELQDRKPAYALAGEVDLVVVRYDDNVSVLYGRCLHRAALMSCLLYTSPSPRDRQKTRMPSSA